MKRVLYSQHAPRRTAVSGASVSAPVQRLHGAALARRVPALGATLRAALYAQVLRRRVKPYVPDFKLAFEHVCIHTGAQPRATCSCGKQRSARFALAARLCTMSHVSASVSALISTAASAVHQRLLAAQQGLHA